MNTIAGHLPLSDLDRFNDYARDVLEKDADYAQVLVQVYALRWQELGDMGQAQVAGRETVETHIGAAMIIERMAALTVGLGDQHEAIQVALSKQCELIGRTLVRWASDATRADADDCIERVTNTEESRDGE